MAVAETLKSNMEEGRVYRTHELRLYSNNLARDLSKLIKTGEVVKAAAGLYYRPKQSRFGKLPVEQTELVRAFLGTDNFLTLSLGAYNQLGVGLTQMYNELVVYNHKRHGKFKLDGQNYSFRVRPDFPAKLTKEFLLVDALNNREELAEDTTRLEQLAAKRAEDLDKVTLGSVAQRYGKVATRKFFEGLAT